MAVSSKFTSASIVTSYAILWALCSPSPLGVVFMSITAGYALLWSLAYLGHEPNEPQPIAGPIPMISPLIGLMTAKEDYYIRLRYVLFHAEAKGATFMLLVLAI
jgi:hypothetical protein